MALLVALEGIDGSGKGTQAGLLKQSLTEEGLRTAVISFPRYQTTTFGTAIGEYLDGRFGTLDQIDPQLASLLYAGDRYESKQHIIDTALENDVVLFDRYVPSNIAHQAARRESTRRAMLIEWIERIEYDIYRLPRANLVLWFDMPVDHAQQLVLKKDSRSYTTSKQDLHEADGDYLENVRRVYASLTDRENWHRVDCMSNRHPRRPQQICDEVTGIIQDW